MTNSEISKLISYWLRHKPDDANLKLDKYGWTDIDDVLTALQKNNIGISKNDLVQINLSFDKIRWDVDLENNKIKATHGHSVDIKMEYTPQNPPEDLYHGTSLNNIQGIIVNGLNSQSRLYVHLSDNIDTAKKTGQRHGKPFIIEIDTKSLLKNGWVFYKTNQNVWLTTDIPTEYLSFGPWGFKLDTKTKNVFLKQLKSEVNYEHILFDKLDDLELIGRCYANDDCLFMSLKDSKYYNVHLTWSKNGGDKIFPHTNVYNDFQDLVNMVLYENHKDYYE